MKDKEKNMDEFIYFHIQLISASLRQSIFHSSKIILSSNTSLSPKDRQFTENSYISTYKIIGKSFSFDLITVGNDLDFNFIKQEKATSES